MFAVCVKKWDGEGGHREHIAGVTDDLATAKQLMVRKAIFMLRLCGQLGDNGRLAYTLGADQSKMSLRLVDHLSWKKVHQDMVDNYLASDEIVHVHFGAKGFTVKIMKVDVYDKDDTAGWEDEWKDHKMEKIEKKEDMIAELKLRLEDM